jgi:hypothetical protein
MDIRSMMASIKLLIFLKTHSQAKGAPDSGVERLLQAGQ